MIPSEALRIVHDSLEAGCNFFDTAPMGMASGRSEELLGQGLKSARRDVIICTKFSHHSADGADDFSTERIRPVLEGSFRRLQTDYVDILLLHNPPREDMDGRVASQYEELEKLKAEGKIREYGVSLDWQAELEMVVETTKSKAIEVMYNVLYQEPRGAFVQAQEHGVGLIVKVPLDSGWLSGRYRGDSRFNDVRDRWSPEVVARRGALVEKFAALVPRGHLAGNMPRSSIHWRTRPSPVRSLVQRASNRRSTTSPPPIASCPPRSCARSTTCGRTKSRAIRCPGRATHRLPLQLYMYPLITQFKGNTFHIPGSSA